MNLFSGTLVTSNSISLSKNFISPNSNFFASSQVSLNPKRRQQLDKTVTTKGGGEVNDFIMLS